MVGGITLYGLNNYYHLLRRVRSRRVRLANERARRVRRVRRFRTRAPPLRNSSYANSSSPSAPSSIGGTGSFMLTIGGDFCSSVQRSKELNNSLLVYTYNIDRRWIFQYYPRKIRELRAQSTWIRRVGYASGMARLVGVITVDTGRRARTVVGQPSASTADRGHSVRTVADPPSASTVKRGRRARTAAGHPSVSIAE